MKDILLVDQGTEAIKFRNINCFFLFFMTFEDLRCTNFFLFILLHNAVVNVDLSRTQGACYA